MSRLISFAVLIGIIAIIGLLFYKVLIGFFVPVFLATVLVVVFRPAHQWMLEKTGHRDRLAAAGTTLLIMLALFLPIGLVVGAATVQGLRLLEQNDPSTILLRINRVRDSLGLEMPPYTDSLRLVQDQIDNVIRITGEPVSTESNSELQRLANKAGTSLSALEAQAVQGVGPRWDTEFDELRELLIEIGAEQEDSYETARLAVEIKSAFTRLRTELLGGSLMAIARETANPTPEDVQALTQNAMEYVRPRLISITGATGSFFLRLVLGTVILIVATYFFLYDGPGMIKTIMFLSPLDENYEQELLLEFDRISRAVVLASILSALAQGLTAGLGYIVVGMDYLLLLFMLTTVFAMVPFVGPAAVWLPVCLYLGLYEERILAATLLAIWGVLVVGTIDNVVKAVVLHGQSELHPLLALLSVLGGVQTLGPIGIVVGPMVVAMLQTLLGILKRELVQFEGQGLALPSSQPDQPRRRFRQHRRSRRRRRNAKGTDPIKSQAGEPEESSQPESRQEHSPSGTTEAPPSDSGESADTDVSPSGQEKSPRSKRRSRHRRSNRPDALE